MNALGKRVKKPLAPAGRSSRTCTGTHSAPQWRQNFCCARLVTQASQKKSWHWLQKSRPGSFGWCLHGPEPTALDGAATTGGAAMGAGSRLALREMAGGARIRAIPAGATARGGGNGGAPETSITVLSREAQKAAGELGSIDETRDFLEQLRAWKTA